MLPRGSSGYLYDVLQVPRNSTTGEIKRQYRKLAMQYHPDRTSGRTTDEFKEIEEAHRILSDPEQRMLYNAVGRSGLKQLGDFGVPHFMRSLGVLQAALFLMSGVLGGLFVTLFLTCYKLDHRHSRLPWTLILLPLWALSPILFISAALYLGVALLGRDWNGMLQGLQLMMTGCIAASTAAALSGLVRPFWALLPWLLLAFFTTLRHVRLLRPSIFRHDADVTSADFDEDAPRVRESGSNGAYCAYAVQTVFKLLCFWAFLGLVTLRVWQGPVRHSRDRAGSLLDRDNVDPRTYRAEHGRRLSFWVVLAPLMVYYGVQTITMAAMAALAGSASPISPRRTGATTAHSALLHTPTTRESELSPSMCARMVGALGFMVAPASMLYMAIMWAMREDYEYNEFVKGYHPSAMLATLPALALLALTTLLPCCVGCGVGAFSIALDAKDDAYDSPHVVSGEDDAVNDHTVTAAKEEPDFRARRATRATAAGTEGTTRGVGTYDSTGVTRITVPATNNSVPEPPRKEEQASRTQSSTTAPQSQSATRSFKDRTADVD